MSIQIRFITNLHELTEAIHVKEIPQLLVGIHENDFAARFPHMLEQAENFADSGTVYKWDIFKINNDFTNAFIHDRFKAALEDRAIFKRDLALDTHDPTISMRFNLDVHSPLGQNTVTFRWREQAPDTCHGFEVCSPSA